MAGRPDAPSTGRRPEWFRFDAVSAEDYEHYRPDYAAAAVAWLIERTALPSSATVVDLGAGTGKLTRLFTGRAGRVIAVEPAANMLSKLGQVVPEALAVAGAAESIPLEDSSIDLVVVGHAFHHFDGPAALREARRVLKRPGHLALLWVRADPPGPVEAAIGAVVDRHITACPVHQAFDRWQVPFRDLGVFHRVETRHFPVTQDLPSRALVPLMATSSDVASLREDRRRELLSELDAYVRGLPEQIAIQRQTEVHLFRPAD